MGRTFVYIDDSVDFFCLFSGVGTAVVAGWCILTATRVGVRHEPRSLVTVPLPHAFPILTLDSRSRESLIRLIHNFGASPKVVPPSAVYILALNAHSCFHVCYRLPLPWENVCVSGLPSLLPSSLTSVFFWLPVRAGRGPSFSPGQTERTPSLSSRSLRWMRRAGGRAGGRVGIYVRIETMGTYVGCHHRKNCPP